MDIGPDLEPAVALPDFQAGARRGAERLDQIGRQGDAAACRGRQEAAGRGAVRAGRGRADRRLVPDFVRLRP